MGLFDTLHDRKLECPYCGLRGYLDLQTKDLDMVGTDMGPIMEDAYVVDSFDLIDDSNAAKAAQAALQLRYIDVSATCRSPWCVAVQNAWTLVTEDVARPSAGRFFRVRYPVREQDGHVARPGEVREMDNIPHGDVIEQFRTKLQPFPGGNPTWGDEFRELQSKCFGSEVLALSMFVWVKKK